MEPSEEEPQQHHHFIPKSPTNLGLVLGFSSAQSSDPNLDHPHEDDNNNNLNQIIDLQTLSLTDHPHNQAPTDNSNNDDDDVEERELKHEINEDEEELKNESQRSGLDENEVNNNDENDWDQLWKAEVHNNDENDWDQHWKADNYTEIEDLNKDENEEESDGVNEYENVDGDGDSNGETVMAVDKEGGFYNNNNNNNNRSDYPVRPDAEDCPFYVKTGTCKFGSHCKFNHPPRRKSYQGAKEKVRLNEENPERPWQIECKYYLTSGGCKYGKACRYNHSRGKTSVAPVLECNFMGLPIRLEEKECPYYMRNGSCKYGSNCRFNHPDPTAVGGDPASGHSNGGFVSLQGAFKSTNASWSSPGMNEAAPVPYVPMMFPPTQGGPPPNPGWSGYQAPVYPTSERILPTPPAFAIKSPATNTNFYSHHHQQQMLADEFPERPDQPECSYFVKTGDCKYRSNCKFHHPKIQIPKMSSCTLSEKGLPLRPDQNICSHYSRYGICKFGPACKFDHPISQGNSTSSVGWE